MKALTNPLVKVTLATLVASGVWAALSTAMGDYTLSSHGGMTGIFGAIFYLMLRTRRS